MISNVCCPIALTFVSVVKKISFLNLPDHALRTTKRGESVRINCKQATVNKLKSLSAINYQDNWLVK